MDGADTRAPGQRGRGFPLRGPIPGLVGWLSWDVAEAACRRLVPPRPAAAVAADGGLELDEVAALLG